MTMLFMAVVLATATAKQRTESVMRSSAIKALSSMYGGKMHAKGLTAVDLKVMRQETQLTVIGYDKGGYAVIANDDMFDAVLGYSDSKFTVEINPGLNWWINTLNKSLEAKMEKGGSLDDPRPVESRKGEVSPMLTTTWDQGNPYNLLCPTYTSGTSKIPCPTGCVATAMAQVMNYYKYPETGVDVHSYVFPSPDGTGTARAKADFEGTTYDWANMLDTYRNNSYNNAQAKAISTLMYHCGVSVDMQYGQGGSGAHLSDAAVALEKHFRYTAQSFMRDYMIEGEWMGIIYNELDAGRPVLYGGADSRGGHAFVFDGYDADGLVHVNWGWSGSGNGYFTVKDLDGYKDDQEMVIAGLPGTITVARSLWALENSLSASIYGGSNLQVSYSGGIYNISSNPFTGTIGCIIENMETRERNCVDVIMNNISNLEWGHGYNISGTRYYDMAGRPAGKYRVYYASKSVEDTDWQMMRCADGLINGAEFTWDGSRISGLEAGSFGETSGITGITTGNGMKPAAKGIYSIEGRYMGNDMEALGKGIYIVNGRKMVK